jgi:hypothetical protein
MSTSLSDGTPTRAANGADTRRVTLSAASTLGRGCGCTDSDHMSRKIECGLSRSMAREIRGFVVRIIAVDLGAHLGRRRARRAAPAGLTMER